jgi:DNA-3-methyladenine glycosylase II
MTFEEELGRAVRSLSRRDAVLRSLIREFGAPSFRPHDDYFRELVEAIVSQQISGRAADSIMKKFREAIGGLMVPEAIAAVPDELLRGAGISPQKLGYLRSLTEHVLDGRIALDRIAQQSDAEVVAELTAVRGIGLWTAQMFLIFSLGRLDVLPTGDLGVRNGMMIAYEMPDPPTPKRMEEVAEQNRWAPYRSVGSWYMWRALSRGKS